MKNEHIIPRKYIKDGDSIMSQNDNPESYENEFTPNHETKKLSTGKKIALVATLLTTGTATALGIALGNNSSAKTESVTNPTETSDTFNENNNSSLNSPETSATDQLGNYVISPELSEDQIAQEFIDNLNSVLTVCMTQETYDACVKDTAKTSWNKWETEYVTPYIDKAFLDMFGANYVSDPEIKLFYDTMLAAAIENLDKYFITVNASIPQPQVTKGSNKPLYQYSLTKDNSSINLGKINIKVTESSNFYETVLGERSSSDPATSPEVTHKVITIDADRSDSTVIITDVVLSSN